jgi:hypothetical protein
MCRTPPSRSVDFPRHANTELMSVRQQKVQFLEAKGLNKQEIDQALQQASSGSSAAFAGYPGNGVPPYDWRDWFIMAVVGGGLAWLGTALARVGLPQFIPSSGSSFERNTSSRRSAHRTRRSCRKRKTP